MATDRYGRDPMSPLSRTDTFTHKGFSVPDPFAPRQRPGASFVNALLATALFRCWHFLVFFGAWSTLITILNNQGHRLYFPTTLLTVLGTVLGFVISYRTTASFERYNEGRRLWSNIIFASRNFARLTWFHVPDQVGRDEAETQELKARALVEKKTVINLLEAFAVSVKHYLRGEDGIYYKDLYHLVKFLPSYHLPAGLPSQVDLTTNGVDLEPPSPVKSQHDDEDGSEKDNANGNGNEDGSKLHQRHAAAPPTLPLPVSASSSSPRSGTTAAATSMKSPRSHVSFGGAGKDGRTIVQPADEVYLLPAHMPPKYSIFDLFPFSLLITYFNKQGHAVKGKKAARIRAQMRNKTTSRNLPLEISLYLGSYIAEIQSRKICDVPTYSNFHANLTTLVDSLTNLERILTTPVPFSYSIHLWVTTIIYCLFLPFQIWETFKWLTIPANVISAFLFFGFLAAGEEIENPFGYDKNDLNLDHFTSNIIRNELKAITSTPPPKPSIWAFVPENNLLFSRSEDERVKPEDWVSKGPAAITASLNTGF